VVWVLEEDWFCMTFTVRKLAAGDRSILCSTFLRRGGARAKWPV
jgi:hypothetical protein